MIHEAPVLKTRITARAIAVPWLLTAPSAKEYYNWHMQC